MLLVPNVSRAKFPRAVIEAKANSFQPVPSKTFGMASRRNDRFPPIADVSGLPDAACMSARPTPYTIGFYVAFALWFTATQYSDPGFYGRLLAPVVESALDLGIVALFLFTVVLAARHG